jgi:putative redox protein
LTVSLAWDGNLEFTGLAGRHEVGIDGETAAAASPMQHLALALAACMAIDLVHILTRGRHTLTSLNATFVGERASVEPKRFTKIALHFTLATGAAPEIVDRAIQLSREKYCSVWGSLRPDTDLAVTYEITAA